MNLFFWKSLFSSMLHNNISTGARPSPVFWLAAYQEIPTAALPDKTLAASHIGLSVSRHVTVPDARPLAAN